MTVARTTLKIAARALLFIIAIVIFYIGLGVGLTLNPTLGTLLWLCAFAVAGLNLFWIFRKRLK